METVSKDRLNYNLDYFIRDGADCVLVVCDDPQRTLRTTKNFLEIKSYTIEHCTDNRLIVSKSDYITLIALYSPREIVNEDALVGKEYNIVLEVKETDYMDVSRDSMARRVKRAEHGYQSKKVNKEAPDPFISSFPYELV